MSNSRRYQIKNALVSKIQAIATPTYNQDLSGVNKLLRHWEDVSIVEGKPWITVLFDDEIRERKPASQTRGVIKFTILGYLKEPDANTDIDTKKENLIEDIEQAVMADVTLGIPTIVTYCWFDKVATCDGMFAPFYMIIMTGEIVYHYWDTDV